MTVEKIDQRIALLGCGNMGGALARAWSSAVLKEPGLLSVYDLDSSKSKAVANECGVTLASDLKQALSGAKIVVLAVKPDVVSSLVANVSKEISNSAKPILLSIAAGVTIKSISSALAENDIAIARAMPNVACIVGAAMTAVYADSEEILSEVFPLFSGIGQCIAVNKEVDLHIATGLAGSGPAYVFTMIDAMADGAVKMGLNREQALTMAAQTVYGAAKMVLASGKHPIALRDTVTSPGGTTITGLHVLEKNAFRGTLISAVEAATRKARGENNNNE